MACIESELWNDAFLRFQNPFSGYVVPSIDRNWEFIRRRYWYSLAFLLLSNQTAPFVLYVPVVLLPSCRIVWAFFRLFLPTCYLLSLKSSLCFLCLIFVLCFLFILPLLSSFPFVTFLWRYLIPHFRDLGGDVTYRREFGLETGFICFAYNHNKLQ